MSLDALQRQTLAKSRCCRLCWMSAEHPLERVKELEAPAHERARFTIGYA